MARALGRLTIVTAIGVCFLCNWRAILARAMDARTADSTMISKQESWLQRERASGRFYDRLGWIIALFLLAMIVFSVWILRRGAEPGTLLSPPLIAGLLIAILLPAIALMVLYARKVAVRRAEQGGLGSGRLHVRLVALFSVIAVVPTVLVAIFASLLFQSGLEFWFSIRARERCSRIRSRWRGRAMTGRSSESPTRP